MNDSAISSMGVLVGLVVMVAVVVAVVALIRIDVTGRKAASTWPSIRLVESWFWIQLGTK